MQNRRDFFAPCLVLGELPRLPLGDVAVEAADELPDAVDGGRDLEPVEIGGDVALQPFGQRPQLIVAGPVALELPVEELFDHLRRSREQVAEVVAELALVALVQSVDRSRPVLAEVDRARAPVAHGVGAVDVDQVERVDDVAERFRDLPVVE